MKKSIMILAAVLTLGTAVSHAQTTYSVVPSTCGTVADQPMSCIADLSPATPLGVYPTLHITDDLVNDSGGLVDWSSTQGPSNECGTAPCYLGGGVVQSGPNGYRSYPLWAQFCSNGACITEVSALTVYFEGTYVQGSGGGTYSGFLTLHFSYVRQAQQGGSYKWIRTAKSGAVTIQ